MWKLNLADRQEPAEHCIRCLSKALNLSFKRAKYFCIDVN